MRHETAVIKHLVFHFIPAYIALSMGRGNQGLFYKQEIFINKRFQISKNSNKSKENMITMNRVIDYNFKETL